MTPPSLLLPLLLDRALVLTPCADPADACWQAVTSFAAPTGLRLAPQRAEVRLAHDGQGHLLVHIGDLPADSALGLTIPDGPSVRLERGLHRVPLPLSSDAQHDLRLHLLTPEGPLPWTPDSAGAASVEDTFPLLLADAPALGLPLTATQEGDQLRLSAPGADGLSLARVQPSWPVPRRGVPEPLSVTTARDHLSVPLPEEGGWYRITATWSGQDVQAHRLYLPPARPDTLHQEGLHPAPHSLSRVAGAPPFRLPDHGAVVMAETADWLPAAVLFAEETERLTGRSLSVAQGRGRGRGRGDEVRLVQDARQPADGFALEIGAGRAEVRASGLRGAVYGALALADLLAAGGGQVAAMVVRDFPDIEERPLLHQLNLGGRGRLDGAVWRTFLRRVVLRGRYNQLYLGLLDSYAFATRPEVGPPEALTRAEVEAMIAEARSLGLEVFPAVSAPGNAAWLTGSDPGLRSSGDPRQLCPRDPAVPPLLSALYEELWSVFGAPRRVHIGHDEVRWSPERAFGDERDPHCAGVPSWVLMSESLRWHVDHFRQRDATPVIWTDALVEDWNGGVADTWRALDALSPGEVLLASWAPVGDNVAQLLARGFRVQRIHTGYQDWKRDDYPDVVDQIAGEGLALFYPFPWAAFGGVAGSRPLPYHWGSVLLAGATAWRADLADTPIAATLHHAAAEDLPAYRPGSRHRAASEAVPLQAMGRADPRLPAPRRPLPASLEVGGLRFGAPRWLVAQPDAPVQVVVGGDRLLRGVSLLQAVATDVATRQRLQGAYREPLSGPPMAVVHAHYADGQEIVAGELRYGLETYEVDGDPRAAVLWGTAGSVALPEETLRLWRWDWHNPRPEVPLHSLTLSPGLPSVPVVVVGAVGW